MNSIRLRMNGAGLPKLTDKDLCPGCEWWCELEAECRPSLNFRRTMKVRITNENIPVPDNEEFEVKETIEAYVLEIGGEDHRVWASDCTVVKD